MTGAGKTYGQCPTNLDFELGNFTGWQCFIGHVLDVNGQNVFDLDPSPPIPNRHQIIPAGTSLLDAYGGFPQSCPFGGSYSVKLGNSLVNAESEGISYTFTVPATQDTFTFTYFYAVVFENPNHASYEQPRFFVSAYDVLTGQTINCASYNYIATSGLPGFEVSAINPNVLFKRWSPVSIQFAGLANRSVRLEFKTADCIPGAHFGYAYIDVSSGCTDILASAPYCIQTNAVVLNAPYGYQSYTWYNSNYSTVMGTGQTITLSPPPVTSGVFHVDLVPYPGFGCRDTADAVVVPLSVPDTPVAVSYYQLCRGEPPDPLTAIALPGHTLQWYTSATGGTSTDVPPVPSTAVPGVYNFYVTQKSLFGCESFRKKITVTVVSIPVASFVINSNVSQCLIGNSYQFTSTSIALFNPQYEWHFGDNQTFTTTGVTAAHTYTNSGTFAVRLRVINESGCSSEQQSAVLLHPKPIALFGMPDTICQNETVVTLTDESYIPGGIGSITTWWWNTGGTVTTLPTPPPFTVTGYAPYNVKMAVRNSLGCLSDTTNINLPVRHTPVTAFSVARAFCENEPLQFTDRSYIPSGTGEESIGQWGWQFDVTNIFTIANPQYNFPAGVHQARLAVASNFGCNSAALDSTFTIHVKPFVGVSFSDSCAKEILKFTAIDVSGTVNKWYWNFGNGFNAGGSEVLRIFDRATIGLLRLSGETINGCRDTITRPLNIYDNLAFAGRDTSAPVNEPVQLNAHGGNTVQYLWSPPDGLSDAAIEKPVATLNRDQTYNLYTISDKGCVRRSRIHILRYKGPDIYVPTAFSPNNDGVNDVFRAVAYGITQFDFLAVYDRFGNELFLTKDVRRGWDGKYKGADADAGTYVFVVKGVDFKGKEVFRKGTVILIR